MRLPAYPKYKPSGVEWLGDVPEHWDVKRGRFCMGINPRSQKQRASGETMKSRSCRWRLLASMAGLT